jgi:hypothetical protein
MLILRAVQWPVVKGGPDFDKVFICRECAKTAHGLFQERKAKRLGLRVVNFNVVGGDESA